MFQFPRRNKCVARRHAAAIIGWLTPKPGFLIGKAVCRQYCNKPTRDKDTAAKGLVIAALTKTWLEHASTKTPTLATALKLTNEMLPEKLSLNYRSLVAVRTNEREKPYEKDTSAARTARQS
ncbi:hypothetical protein [Burkholderia sp. Leaf177]|uniref:hypothetical protein n=1 Tax=Burkholderia sp. Leaf177 TaxID=1736287 RepID=UPI0012E37966|nr:hypothetical protein [Burkholderia sp. Leaf177]